LRIIIVQSKREFEVIKMKLTKKTAILVLVTAVVLFSAPTVVTVFAHSSGPGIGLERGYFGTFVEHIITRDGFALNEAKSSQIQQNVLIHYSKR
jgi:hypothetical protein